MSSDKQTDGSKSSGNGSCLRAGIPESDTGESGEESEPTYRHYDNFETDVCLTQDEDDDPTDLSAGVVRDLGQNLQPVGNGISKINSSGIDKRDLIHKDLNGINRGMSSDSDSCTESELTQGQGQATDDTTTTSTSESEETQIWVPISKRPSARLVQDTTSDPPPSATSSNGSDQSRPQSYIHKASSLPPAGAGSLTYVTSPSVLSQMEKNNSRAGSHDSARRDSRDSWHTLQSNLQSSGVNKRVSPSKQVSLGLLRHDETTGTITLDIRNVPNGDSGLGHEDGQYTPSDDTLNAGGANMSMLKGRNARDHRFGQNMSFTESVCVVCSGLYMLFVVVSGLILPIAEVFVSEPYPALFEGFYIYLYVMSIAFLVYAYSYLLRIRTFSVGRRGRTIVSSVPVHSRKRNTCIDEIEQQTGSFYLRLGAVGFGIGSMIKSGLHFGEYFEMTTSPNCAHVLFGIRPILHLCFTFIQLYFVFLNSKMMIHRYRYLARIGLMHMIATNIAVWFEDIVRETLRELGRASAETVVNNTAGQNKMYSLSTSGLRVIEQYGFPHCQGDSLMGEVVEMSSPYLYPCSILYSIICASILFVMWLNLGKRDWKLDRNSEEGVPKERSSVDCSSSSRGLFLGIIIFVAAVIILITFFVLVRTDEFMNTAVRLDHLGDVAIFVLTTISLILAFHRTHGLRYPEQDQGPGFEDALLVISVIGVFILCIANIIAGILTDVEHYGHLIILSSCLRCVQASVQTLYLLNTMRKSVWKREHEEAKTGREFVTFLLICNIALWGMNIFEVQRSEANPVQAKFYGSVAWNIITHVSVPFAIFYRFHSTVCLANIWKHAWKFRN
ncbi:proton channel OtopLc-like [Mercenaria mercenaria]|uniref:proton channel OtopLc-like n=1 Tax=Mercenaria mercenaria TaxID=6596 RepID=UPI00234E6818|nr:proton channel OtopLc-like [Mercenaria mercenaria]